MKKQKFLAFFIGMAMIFGFLSCQGDVSGYVDQLTGGTEKNYAAPVTFDAVWSDGEESSVILSMETATAGAKIYYTTDGSTPTSDSSEYTESLTIAAGENVTTIKAIAVVSEKVDGKSYENSPVSCAVISVKEKTITKIETEIKTEYVDKTYASPVTFKTTPNEDGSVKLEMSCETEGAVIYFVSGEANPDENSEVYLEPIVVQESASYKAIAKLSGIENSAVSSVNITIKTNEIYKAYAKAVVFDVKDGEGDARKVELSTATEEAAIYYTTDGSIPTVESTLYDGNAIAVTKDTVIKAIAVKEGIEVSPVSVGFVAVKVIVTNTVYQPKEYASPVVITAAETAPKSGIVRVTLTSSDSVFYTTDGSEPDSSSTAYEGPFTVSATTTVKAIAVSSDSKVENSPVSSVLVSINEKEVETVVTVTKTYAASVVFAITDGENNSKNVTLTSATEGAQIYYTVDGSVPTSESSLYSGDAINVTSETTIKAIAVKEGIETSPIAAAVVALYTRTEYVDKTYASPVSFVSEDAGNGIVSVTLSTTTEGADIYYTIDGSEPASTSTKYTSAISVDEDKVIKAFAVKEGIESSSVSSIKVVIKERVIVKNYVSAVTYTTTDNPDGSVTIVLNCATEGAVIYYTDDNSQPSSSSMEYNPDAELTFTDSATIKAIAFKDGMEASPVSIARVSITVITTGNNEIIYRDKVYAAPVQYAISSGENGSKIVELSCPTENASIYYTTNGATPTALSTLYENAINVTEETTIKAIAVSSAANVQNSPISTALVTIVEYQDKDYAASVSFTANETAPGSGIVTITMASEADSAIYYTTDGSTPTAESTPYTEAFTVNASTDFKAVAIVAGKENSPVSNLRVVINEKIVDRIVEREVLVDKTYASAVSFAISGDGNTRSVALSSSTEGASIYYTTDGSTPDAGSILYTEAFSVTGNATVKAIAIKEGIEAGPISVALVAVNTVTNTVYQDKTYAEPVTFTVTAKEGVEGTYIVAMSTTTEGAAIYYTADGSRPTNESIEYTGPFEITESSSCMAIAVKAGMENSAVSAAAVAIVEKTVTVSPVEDTEAPADVTDLVAVVKDRAVELSWTNAEDEDIFGYEVSYNGNGIINRAFGKLTKESMIVASDAEGCIISGLTNGKVYSFTVKSIDLSGNKSEGVTITATPAASTADLEPLEFTLSVPPYATNQDLVVTVNVTNASVVRSVVYKLNGSRNAKTLFSDEEALSATEDPEDNSKWTFTIPADKNTNGKRFAVGVLDSLGRRETEEITINSFDFTPLGKITNLSASYNGETNKFTLTWNDPADSTDPATDSPLDHIVISYRLNDEPEENDASVNVAAGVQTLEIDADRTQGFYTFWGLSVDQTGNESAWAPSNNGLVYNFNYTVSFNLNGEGAAFAEGTENTKTVTYSSTYGELPVPSRAGYSFDGWFTQAEAGEAVTASSNVTASDITLYAHWTLCSTFTVTFDTNVDGVTVPSQTVNDGEYASNPETYGRVEGKAAVWYTLAEWEKADTDESKTAFDFANTAITGNITLYAVWKDALTVTFKNAEGTEVAPPVHLFPNEKVSAPEITIPEGKDAVWYTEAEYAKESAEAGTGTAFDFAQTEITENTVLVVVFVDRPAEVTDVLDRSVTGITSTSYADFSGKTVNSTASYLGQCAGGTSSNPCIQLRSKNNNSGIVTATSGGKVKSVRITWSSGNSDTATLEIYGKNEAYSAASDLYGDNKGDLISEVAYNNGVEQTIEVTGDYDYIGFRSKNGALYITSITIVWE